RNSSDGAMAIAAPRPRALRDRQSDEEKTERGDGGRCPHDVTCRVRLTLRSCTTFTLHFFCNSKWEMAHTRGAKSLERMNQRVRRDSGTRRLRPTLLAMPKQPHGTPGKEPPAPSVKARLDRKAPTKPRQVDHAETGRRSRPVSVRRARS